LTRLTRTRLGAVAALVAGLTASVLGQAVASLTLLSVEGRRTLPIAIINNQEFVALEDLAAVFGFTVKPDGGSVTLQRGNATLILTPGQTLVSSAGRAVSLTLAPMRAAGRVMVPLEFISRALGPAAGIPLDLRRPSRLVVVGDMVVPRVTVRYESAADSARVIVEAIPRAAATVTPDGSRLLIRFTADALDAALPGPGPQGFVTGARLADAVTLAIDLGPRVASHRSTTEPLPNGSRLLLDLLSSRTEAPTLTGAGPRPAPAPAPAPPAELSGLGARGPALQTLVIDPGHGGDDVGARGPGGALEKDITLAVARRLKVLVESRMGLRVLLTREDDRAVSLERRTAMANNNKADVLLSLHANASPVAKAAGASMHVAMFDDARQAQQSVVAERVPTFRGGSRELELVPWDVAQIRHQVRSSELAELLASVLGGVLPLAARPVERGPYRVLESANMAAVIMELGYLTNADEEARLASGGTQDQIAQAILDALVRFQQALAPGGNDR
jgi:N-acetylmuramoyl-L-alanine amidase